MYKSIWFKNLKTCRERENSEIIPRIRDTTVNIGSGPFLIIESRERVLIRKSTKLSLCARSRYCKQRWQHHAVSGFLLFCRKTIYSVIIFVKILLDFYLRNFLKYFNMCLYVCMYKYGNKISLQINRYKNRHINMSNITFVWSLIETFKLIFKF